MRERRKPAARTDAGSAIELSFCRENNQVVIPSEARNLFPFNLL